MPAPRTASPAARTGPYGPFGATAGGVRLALFDARATALALPVPRVDANDPNAGFLAGLMASAPAELIAALQAVPAASLETRLRELRARLEMREPDSAAGALTDLEGRHPDDWRVVWYRGITSLVTGDHEVAALSFDAVYDAFPGEPAPKLALGICAEVLGQLDNAAEYYRLVWATDPSFVSAAFGLARVQIAAGDRAGAAHTLESVPEASIHYTAARVTAVRARLRERDPAEPLLADLTAAAVQVAALTGFGLDPVRREQLTTEVLGKALDWILSGSPGAPPPGGSAAAPPGTRKLLDAELDERGLRLGLERSYRMLARLAQRATRGSNWWSGPTVSAPGRGCEDVREPPAARPGEVPRLRGAAGVRRPVLRCVRLRPVGRAGPPRRPADDGDHGAAGCPGGACRVADGPARACRTAPGGPARTRRARASRGGRPVARRIGDGQLRRARARAPGDGPARHGLGRQAVADDASGAPRRPGGGGSGRHGTRRRARRTPYSPDSSNSPDSSGDFALAAPDPRTAEPTPTPAASTKVCVACRSGRVDPDGYCENCGHAQPRERDHMEQELGSVAAVSDRGLRHHRNEDSFAVSSTALPDGSPAVVAIVCDGVSSASRPDEASAAAAVAANEALLESLPRGTHPQQAMHEAIVAASEAVNVLAQDPPGAAEHEAHRHQNAPACTLVGAIMAGGLLVVGWVGDSRVYWVPEDRTGPPARLTEDDSWAAQMVAAGLMNEAEAYADERAHAITGWLGADSYELEPHTASFKPDRPGLVVVCTDGLWNYAESAEEMAAAVPPEAHLRPLHGAQVLVGHALDGGGHDNVTVALLPFTVEQQGAGSACTTV